MHMSVFGWSGFGTSVRGLLVAVMVMATGVSINGQETAAVEAPADGAVGQPAASQLLRERLEGAGAASAYILLAHCCHAHPYYPYDRYCCHGAAVRPRVYVNPYGSVRRQSRRVGRRTARRVGRRR